MDLDFVFLGRSEGTVLDIGCSIGILEQFIPSIGIDVRHHAIREAKESCPSMEFMLADAESLPFKAESVDAIIMLDNLEHIEDESKALAEASRILRNMEPYFWVFRIINPSTIS